MNGTTTRQMQDAPAGAFYVWHNGDLSYPRRLQAALDRRDLHITSAAALALWWAAGTHVVIDHHVHITPARAVEIAKMMQNGVIVHHIAGKAEIAYAAFEAARAGWVQSAPAAEPSLHDGLRAVVDAIKAKMQRRAPTPPAPPVAPRPRDQVAYELYVERAKFDGTYIFSNDRETFMRGERHFKRICALQDELDRSEA